MSLSQLLTLAFSILPCILLDSQACRTLKRSLRNTSSKWHGFQHSFFLLIPGGVSSCACCPSTRCESTPGSPHGHRHHCCVCAETPAVGSWASAPGQTFVPSIPSAHLRTDCAAPFRSGKDFGAIPRLSYRGCLILSSCIAVLGSDHCRSATRALQFLPKPGLGLSPLPPRSTAKQSVGPP